MFFLVTGDTNIDPSEPKVRRDFDSGDGHFSNPRVANVPVKDFGDLSPELFIQTGNASIGHDCAEKYGIRRKRESEELSLA